MRNFFLKTVLILIIFSMAVPAQAQSSPAQGFDMTGFPQWSKDLRRGEIVAFGSFPFTMFLTSFVLDTYRTSANGWDRRYAPWPFRAAGGVDMTQEERLLSLGIAVGGSIMIAVADHIIVRYRRNKLEREISNMPDGTPIIIRQPLVEASSGESDFVLESETP